MRRTVVYFVSYARKNADLARRFMDRFCDQTGPSRAYEYRAWQDQDILVGENWHDEIQNAIKESVFGLLLVSPAFLASKYITGSELPHFVGHNAKPVIPVMLQPVDLERHDLKGLEKNQIYRLSSSGLQAPRSFFECKKQRRDEFASDLFKQVESRLDKLFRDAGALVGRRIEHGTPARLP
jgi:hypothetical protein